MAKSNSIVKGTVPAVRVKGPTPKFKKDGKPYTPWAEEVALRMAKKAEKAAQGIVEDRRRKCKAMTTGVHGPKRPCARWAVRGLTVCPMHGGSTKAAKQAAKARLLDELDPTISRLVELRDQDAHMPTALGAATQIMNRVMGKPDSVDKDKGAGRPSIHIGIAIGGIPAKSAVVVQELDEGAIEGELVDDGEDEDSE